MRLLIVDDHRLVAELLASYLGGTHEIAGVLHDPDEVRSWLEAHKVDLILLDGTLPRCDLAKLIQFAEKRAKVVIVTMHQNTSRWPGLRRMGVIGVLGKTLPLDEFAAEVLRLGTLSKPADDGDRVAQIPEPTNRHLQILIGMARGGQTKQIAKECGLSPARTSELIGEVLELTRAGTWAQAVLVAVENGWIEPRVPPPPVPGRIPLSQPSEDDHRRAITRVPSTGSNI